jgi:transcriptional regulator with XRE-family HTH domain
VIAEHTRLTAGLRELRARTGLSLAALSERTAYSKSSWERCLNGKSLLPREAVQDLCRALHRSLPPQVSAYGLDAVKTRSGWLGNAFAPREVAAARQGGVRRR